MIKNDRQYAATRSQLRLLDERLAQPYVPEEGVHPMIGEAALEGLREQANDLRTEIAEYEGLRDGVIPAPRLDVLEDLPRNLIRARLAMGLSQRALAERLGVAEQQVQRYESNEYAGASLARLREVAAALQDVPVSEGQSDLLSAGPSGLIRRLTEIGLDRSVAQRLVGPTRVASGHLTTAATAAAHALGVPVDALLDESPPELAGAGARFKMRGSGDTRRANAYAAYAFTIARIVARGTRVGVVPEIAMNPLEIREACVAGGEGPSFRSLLNYSWSRGVAVLPLPDRAAFHAAYWRIEGQHVVVLKQRTQSVDRWIFDLGHELCHVTDAVIDDLKDSSAAVVDDDSAPGWAQDPVEQRANMFAAAITLGEDAEALAQRAATRSQGKVELLKQAVPEVAGEAAVSTGALANYVAFRLMNQGINWWPTASGLQDQTEDPWRIARDVLLHHIDFSLLDEKDRTLLVEALSEWGRT